MLGVVQKKEVIEEIKNINMQLKAIYDIDENEFTQEIIELAEELIVKKQQ